VSVQSYIATMTPYARQAAQATGLDCRLFLVQWALESGWAASDGWGNWTCNNEANMSCAPCSNGGYCSCGVHGSPCFCCYPTLQDFTDAYLAFLHNGNYAGVLAATGQPLTAQFQALGQSPWDCGHYGCSGGGGCPTCANAGNSLIAIYQDFQSDFDNACPSVAPPSPPPTNPCAGVSCDACSTCSDGTCFSACPAGWSCVAGECLPPFVELPAKLNATTVVGTALVLVGLIGSGIAVSRLGPVRRVGSKAEEMLAQGPAVLGDGGWSVGLTLPKPGFNR